MPAYRGTTLGVATRAEFFSGASGAVRAYTTLAAPARELFRREDAAAQVGRLVELRLLDAQLVGRARHHATLRRTTRRRGPAAGRARALDGRPDDGPLGGRPLGRRGDPEATGSGRLLAAADGRRRRQLLDVLVELVDARLGPTLELTARRHGVAARGAVSDRLPRL